MKRTSSMGNQPANEEWNLLQSMSPPESRKLLWILLLFICSIVLFDLMRRFIVFGQGIFLLERFSEMVDEFSWREGGFDLD